MSRGPPSVQAYSANRGGWTALPASARSKSSANASAAKRNGRAPSDGMDTATGHAIRMNGHLADENELLRRYAETHDPRLKEELVKRFLPLARSLALRY